MHIHNGKKQWYNNKLYVSLRSWPWGAIWILHKRTESALGRILWVKPSWGNLAVTRWDFCWKYWWRFSSSVDGSCLWQLSYRCEKVRQILYQTQQLSRLKAAGVNLPEHRICSSGMDLGDFEQDIWGTQLCFMLLQECLNLQVSDSRFKNMKN